MLPAVKLTSYTEFSTAAVNLEHELPFLPLAFKGQKKKLVSWSKNTTSVCHNKLKFVNVSPKNFPIAWALCLKDMLRHWIWHLCAGRCKKQFEA